VWYQDWNLYKSSGTLQVYLSLGIPVVNRTANLCPGCVGEECGNTVGDLATLSLVGYHIACNSTQNIIYYNKHIFYVDELHLIH